ncbi:MAG TPA: phytanoyl-CoA dioxygenase family protein [Thermoanaerobaculia bacterium]|nr:phytanoyl-CoA dioxygenase family protein [Thermoanaerobaculia bacterium]
MTYPQLSRADIDRFYDDGYLVLEGLFAPKEVAAMAAAAERVRAVGRALGVTLLDGDGEGADAERKLEHAGSQFVFGAANPQSQTERLLRQATSRVAEPMNGFRHGGGARRLLRVVWAGGCEPALLACGRDPRLTGVVGQLFGSGSAVHLLNQLHAKYPNDGLEFEPHQDSEHRRYGTPEWRDRDGRGSYVQAVVAIDDSTLDNGPLVFYPGSGRGGHRDPAEVRSEYQDRDGVPALLAAGSAAFFGPYVVHRSAENRGGAPRRILINGFAYPGANSRAYFGAGTGVPVDLPAPRG